MNLRGIVNAVTQTVNPNVTVTLRASTGYTVGAGARQVPSYAAPVTGPAQVQALDNAALQHIEGLNQQGNYRAIYLRGPLHGVIRPDGIGGDLIEYNGKTWLVVKILETWPDWTKAVICQQLQ